MVRVCDLETNRPSRVPEGHTKCVFVVAGVPSPSERANGARTSE
jgi:hypothetical protein